MGGATPNGTPSLFDPPEPLRCVDCEHADPDDSNSYVCASCQEKRLDGAFDGWNEQEGDWDHA